MPFEPEHLISMIRHAMPPSAEIRLVPGIAALTIGVSWKLGNDPNRPNKMSRTIAIEVTREAAQDFESAADGDQASAYARIDGFLAKQLAGFDPNHDSPRDEPPPVERWVIDSNLLFRY